VKAQGGRQALGTICQTEEEERGFRPRKMKGEGCPENTPWGAPTVLLLPPRSQRKPKGRGCGARVLPLPFVGQRRPPGHAKSPHCPWPRIGVASLSAVGVTTQRGATRG
jgi:hypothetical protein